MANGKFERKTTKRPSIFLKILKGIFMTAAAAVSMAVTLQMAAMLLLHTGTAGTASQTGSDNAAIMDRYDMHMTNRISTALEGVLSIDKVYWLRDEDLVAPKPDPSKFGETDDPTTLQWLLDDASELLQGQETLFTTQTQLLRGSTVRYYLDETILAITWKQVMDGTVYTISEVKIAHPSQFRRFLAGGEFGSEKLFITTEMAQSVNSVVASSGDFYRFRKWGVIVYDGQVQRVHGVYADTCYIDDNGDMHFTHGGDILDPETAQKFADENNIRFSMAFGPVLVDNGVRCEPAQYSLGEINEEYARAALCQKGDLHYLLVTANTDSWYDTVPTIHTFAKNVATFNVEKAYALDGGQTAVIAMNGKLINRVVYGYQRRVSDIIYFATAVPDGE